MFKIMGAIAVIVAAGLIGGGKYGELYERRRLLHTIRDGAEKIRNNLSCLCMPLYECFLSGGEFFEKVAKEMSGDVLPSDAIKMRANKLHRLDAEDKECVFRFADGLCANDCDGQIRNVELFIKELEKRMEKADAEFLTKGKLFVKGSLLAASALVLMLI